jgi:hypothetical protein
MVNQYFERRKKKKLEIKIIGEVVFSIHFFSQKSNYFSTKLPLRKTAKTEKLKVRLQNLIKNKISKRCICIKCRLTASAKCNLHKRSKTHQGIIL